MTLQEHYNAIKDGKGNKAQFLKQARQLFPEYINQYSDYNTATHILKSKQIISEANNVGGVVSKGFDIWNWKKILAEETKAEEKNTSKEVLDNQKNAYDNKDMKNADNVNFNEIMKGFYAELRDEKNNGKTGDEIKAMVVKNLAKDPLYYTKNGMFGEKGVGYTTEAPGLGTPKEPKGKYKSSGYGDLDTDAKQEKPKANVQDSLGDKEAKTSMPSKVKEMEVTPQNSPGVKKMPMPGKEKKIKLKEEIKWKRQLLNENIHSDADKWASLPEELQDDLLLSYDKEGFGYSGMSWNQLPDHITANIARDERFINYGKEPIRVTPDNAVKADKDIPGLGMTESISDKDIQTKYNEMFGKNPQTTFADVAKALNVPEDQVKAALAGASMHGMSFQEQKLRSLIQQIIKEELNDETDLDNRLKDYVENEMPKQEWKSIKNYYLEMTQDKPEPKKAYFKLVDGILKKHGY